MYGFPLRDPPRKKKIPLLWNLPDFLQVRHWVSTITMHPFPNPPPGKNLWSITSLAKMLSDFNLDGRWEI